jgi:hypothetical protein
VYSVDVLELSRHTLSSLSKLTINHYESEEDLGALTALNVFWQIRASVPEEAAVKQRP